MIQSTCICPAAPATVAAAAAKKTPCTAQLLDHQSTLMSRKTHIDHSGGGKSHQDNFLSLPPDRASSTFLEAQKTRDQHQS